MDKSIFPCTTLPEQPALARLAGLYPQRQEGLWMQRVKVLGGVLTGPQWRVLAEIIHYFTPATPLHLTTRQDIELHDLTADVIPAVQQMMFQAGLTGLGACGDTLRNITVCPCGGVVSGSANLLPMAWQIRKLLESYKGIYTLPRKFKISLSCGESCGQPWINDLGLVWNKGGFHVIAGGSLGPLPATGMLFAERIDANDVLPLALAAVRVFDAHGDRQNRGKARLRHVRKKMGDDAFANLLRTEFEAVKSQQKFEPVKLEEITDGLDERLILTFSNGDITPQAAEVLAAIAENKDLAVRIANNHRVIIFGRDAISLRSAVERLPALRDAARPQASVVACPGLRWCARALTDTNDMAARIRKELAGKLPADANVWISGCPNGCAQSTVADIGLVGVIATIDGKRQQAYNLFIGGGKGHSDKLAQQIASKLPADEVIKEIKQRF